MRLFLLNFVTKYGTVSDINDSNNRKVKRQKGKKKSKKKSKKFSNSDANCSARFVQFYFCFKKKKIAKIQFQNGIFLSVLKLF